MSCDFLLAPICDLHLWTVYLHVIVIKTFAITLICTNRFRDGFCFYKIAKAFSYHIQYTGIAIG